MQLRIGARPGGGRGDVVRIERGVQDVREQRIRIERDRRQQRIKLRLAKDALGVRVQRSQSDHQTKQDAECRFHAANLDPTSPGCCINV